VGTKSFLERREVLPATVYDYQKRYNLYTLFCRRRRLVHKKPNDVDTALVELLTEMYFDGLSAAEGSKLLAAVLFMQGLPKGLTILPRSRSAIGGWTRLAPLKSRLPLPWLVVVLMIAEMVKAGQREAALMTAVAFCFYLRPSEAVGLTEQCLVPPVGSGRSRARCWCLVLHPEEDGVASKTGQYDESLLADSTAFPFMPEVLRFLQSRKSGRCLLFGLTYAQWRAAFVASFLPLALEEFGSPVLHQLRHGGASHEMMTGARDILGVQKRGRWGSVRSLRRYEKGGRVGQLLSKLPKETLDEAEELAGRIGKILVSGSV
jgi:hypothetical protein